MALLGEDHRAGQVSIPRTDIASVTLKSPKVLGAVNGNLVVTTSAGKRYQVHFRKKDAVAFEALAADLGA